MDRKNGFSRRSFLQGSAVAAGLLAGTRLGGGGVFGRAWADAPPEDAAVCLVYMMGGYNAIFPCAGPFSRSRGHRLQTGSDRISDKARRGTAALFAH